MCLLWLIAWKYLFEICFHFLKQSYFKKRYTWIIYSYKSVECKLWNLNYMTLLLYGNRIHNLQQVLYEGWLNIFGSIIWEARKNNYIITSTPEVIKPNRSNGCYREKSLLSKKRSFPHLEQTTTEWIAINVHFYYRKHYIYIVCIIY